MRKIQLKLKTGFILCLSMSFLISCESEADLKYYITSKPEQIPPDIGKAKETILVVDYQKEKSKKNKEFSAKQKEHFTNIYHGTYIIVSEKDLKSTQYADSTVYRYVFDASLYHEKYGSFVSGGSGDVMENHSFMYSFFIVDRLKKDTFRTSVRRTEYSRLLKVYLEAIEETRVKNGGK